MTRPEFARPEVNEQNTRPVPDPKILGASFSRPDPSRPENTMNYPIRPAGQKFLTRSIPRDKHQFKNNSGGGVIYYLVK